MVALKKGFGQGLEGVNARGGVDRVLVDGRQGLKLGWGDRVKSRVGVRPSAMVLVSGKVGLTVWGRGV